MADYPTRPVTMVGGPHDGRVFPPAGHADLHPLTFALVRVS